VYWGGVYRLQGEIQDALKYNEHCLEIRREIYGEEHNFTAGAYDNIGFLYQDIIKRPLSISRRHWT